VIKKQELEALSPLSRREEVVRAFGKSISKQLNVPEGTAVLYSVFNILNILNIIFQYRKQNLQVRYVPRILKRISHTALGNS
jgi:hypothetical protein